MIWEKAKEIRKNLDKNGDFYVEKGDEIETDHLDFLLK